MRNCAVRVSSPQVSCVFAAVGKDVRRLAATTEGSLGPDGLAKPASSELMNRYARLAMRESAASRMPAVAVVALRGSVKEARLSRLVSFLRPRIEGPTVDGTD